MQIQGLQNTQATQPIQRPAQPRGNDAGQAAAPAASRSPVDQLDFSAEAQQLSESQAAGAATNSDGIRVDKVAQIRQAIADGSYDTPEKMDLALDKLLDAFA